MNNIYVNISAERLHELQEAEAWLNALEEAGVDNWEGIDTAREIYNENNIVEGDE